MTRLAADLANFDQQKFTWYQSSPDYGMYIERLLQYLTYKKLDDKHESKQTQIGLALSQLTVYNKSI